MSDVEARLRRLEDIERIRLLDATYCRLLDDGDWPGLVALFTPDGVFDGLREVRGHADLLAFFGGLADGGLTAFWHHVTNLEVRVDGDTATAGSLLWQPCVVDGVAQIAAGRYSDRLVRTADGWRFTLKRVRFDYWVPMGDGWGHHRFGFAAARKAATPRPDATEP